MYTQMGLFYSKEGELIEGITISKYKNYELAMEKNTKGKPMLLWIK